MKGRRVQGGDKGDLRPDINKDTDKKREQHCSWKILLGVLTLPSPLHCLFKTQKRKDNSAEWNRQQNCFEPSGAKPVGN